MHETIAPGQLLVGRYLLLRLLGDGGMGQVFLAEDILWDRRRIALKTLRPAVLSPEAIADFKGEFAAMARLRHPNLVEVYDFGGLPGSAQHYLTMEFVPGPSLRDIATPIPWDTLRDYALQACEALEFIHARGFIHRDIKPGNLLLAPAETAGGPAVLKVADFGLATGSDDPRRRAAVGTLHYLAPEVLGGGTADRRTDLYSLGAVLFHLATGRPPHADGLGPAALEQLRQGDPPPPDSLPGEIPDDLGAAIRRLLDPVPGRRFPTAAAVARALGANPTAAPAERATAWSRLVAHPPLVGRDREIERIRTLLAALPGGGAAARPLLVLLRGEAGIGKTRLLRESRVLAQLSGIEVLEIGLDAAGTGSDTLLRHPHAGMPAGADAGPEEAPDPDPAGRLAAAVARIAGRSPVLLCIEDLARADRAGIVLLRRLARLPPSLPLLVLATLREEDLPGSAADAALPALLARGRAVEMSLGRLTAEEVRALVGAMLGIDVPPAPLVERLVSQTHGNPFFLEECLRSLAEEGALIRGPEGWRLDADALARVGAPASAMEAVRRRLGLIDPQARHALEALAVRGQPATDAELAGALGIEAKGVRAALRRLGARGLVVETTAAPGADAEVLFAVGHPWFARAALEEAPEASRRELHRHFSARLSREAGTPPEELARHLLGAGEALAAAPLLRRAAEEAERQQDHDRAIDLLGQVLALLPPGPGADRADLEERVARAQERIGASMRAQEAYERALAATAADAGPLARPHLHERISWNASIRGDYPAALEHAREALAGFLAAGDAAGEAEARKGMGVALARQGDFAGAQACYEEALALFRRLGNQDGVASIWNNLGLVRSFRGDADGAADFLEKALTVRGDMGDRKGRIGPLINLAFVRNGQGRCDEALRLLDECHQIATALGDRQNAGNALMMRAESLRRLGALEGAVRALQAALRIHEETGDAARELHCHDDIGGLLRSLGDVAAAAEHHRRALQLAQRLREPVQEAFALGSLGLDRLGLGEPGAIEDLERALEMGRTRGNPRAEARALRGLALAEAMRGRWEAMGTRADRLILVAETDGLDEDRAWGQRLLGEAQLGRGELEAGRRTLREACGAAAKLGRPEMEREVLLLLADSYHRGGRPGDALEARQRAQQILEAMAMKIDDDELRHTFLASAGRPAAPPSERSAPLLAGAKTPQERSRGLGAIYEIGQAINSILEPEELLDRVMDLAIESLRADRGLVILFDGPDGEMRARVARNLDHETIDDAIAYSRHVVREAAGGRPVLSLDAAHDERFKDFRSVRLHGIRSLLCAPLRLRGQVVGTVYLDSRRPGVVFQDEDLQFLEVFANMAALALHNAREFDGLRRENRRLRDEIRGRFAFGSIVGKSPRMHAVFDVLAKVADSNLPVLIQGESGTGKELVAQAIHFNGPRREGRFCSENCAAITETLLESELFGHVRGAFTGADSARAGLFEIASGGTLFLDEIGDMSMAMQGKVLRAIQEGEIRPVGGKRTIKVDVRLLSATNKDLDRLLAEGRFREDLYYRLNVVKVTLPPLRDRKEDIPLLVDHFLHKIAVSSRKPEKRLDVDALSLILRYHWPGNVRELENEVYKLAVFSESDVITLDDLHRHQDLFNKLTDLGQESPLESIEEVERKQILRALQESGGHRGRAAQMLGISRATIFRKIKQYGISS